MSDVSTAARPFNLQDMVKVAMSSAMGKEKISEAARRELSTEKTVKEASAHKTASVSTDHAEKVAHALSFMASELRKEASAPESKVGPGKGPGALELSASTGKEGPSPGGVNRGTAASVPPMNPGTGKARPTDPATQMDNDMHSPAAGMTGKSASAGEPPTVDAASIRKAASELKKTAENALNPAKISGPPAVPPDASDATQSKGGFGGNSGLVASNKSAINYTKGQAKAPVRGEMKKHLDETAMKDGEALRAAFSHTGQAGTKMASAEEAKALADKTLKVASARSLLTRLAGKV